MGKRKNQTKQPLQLQPQTLSLSPLGPVADGQSPTISFTTAPPSSSSSHSAVPSPSPSLSPKRDKNNNITSLTKQAQTTTAAANNNINGQSVNHNETPIVEAIVPLSPTTAPSPSTTPTPASVFESIIIKTASSAATAATAGTDYDPNNESSKPPKQDQIIISTKLQDTIHALLQQQHTLAYSLSLDLLEIVKQQLVAAKKAFWESSFSPPATSSTSDHQTTDHFAPTLFEQSTYPVPPMGSSDPMLSPTSPLSPSSSFIPRIPPIQLTTLQKMAFLTHLRICAEVMSTSKSTTSSSSSSNDGLSASITSTTTLPLLPLINPISEWQSVEQVFHDQVGGVPCDILIVGLLLLAKEQPYPQHAKCVIEHWISTQPDAYYEKINRQQQALTASTTSTTTADTSIYLELTQYERVVEIYCVYVLGRYGEFDYAREFLEFNDSIRSEKKLHILAALERRKEAAARRLASNCKVVSSSIADPSDDNDRTPVAPVPAKQTAATVTLDGTTTGGSIHSLALNGSSTSDPSLSASTLHRPTSPISLLSSTSKGAGHRMSNAKLDLKHAKKNSNGSNSGINSPLRISSAAVANVSSPSSASGKNTAVSPPVRSNRINGDGSVASSSSCFASACSSSSYPPSPISKVVGIDDEGGESTEAAVNTAASTGTSSNNSGGGIVPSSSSSSAPWWSWLLKRAAQHYTSFIQVSALPPAVAPALVIAIMTVTFMAVFKAVIPQRYRDLVKTRVMQMIQILLQSA